jgi:RNA polymerase sigma-70 factor (ECF subfamily)
MTAVSRDEQAAGPAAQPGALGTKGSPGVPPANPPEEADPMAWVAALRSAGAERSEALRDLHALMVRAAAHQVWRMRSALPDPSPSTVDIIVNQAADEAMTALLGKLDSFQGRSRFTTWAFKFAILQAATEVRRVQWQHREVQWRDLDEPRASTDGDPETHAEGADLSRAVASAMREVLTPYQRRVAVAMLVDGVPIDVLADRLGTSRGALYTTLHDVRVRLRAELTAKGYLQARHAGPGRPEPARTSLPADHFETHPTRTRGLP